MINYSLNNRKVIFFFLMVLLVGGIFSFERLGKKEDAPFVIKQAMVFVSYPGASAKEVEDKVTRIVERKLQTMPNIYRINSDSYQGMAKIAVELQPYTPASEIEQMWDILRRKMDSVEGSLPRGSSIVVNDDFGEVFGIYLGLVAGDGFDYEDLRYWSKEIERRLSTVDGVQQVSLFGNQKQIVKVSISMSKLASLNLTPTDITSIISSQNHPIHIGERKAGEMEMKFFADGEYRELSDIENQVVISGKSGEVRLGDIAQISLDYATPTTTIMNVNGKKAVGIAISSPSDRDVVKTGRNVWKEIQEIERSMPLGLSIESLYAEDKIAEEANGTFILNLIESIAIVILILLLTMGFRSSVVIGSSLLFSISGTLLIMEFLGVGLNRTSLAGFIIAMGMLVDNAIVVADNGRINMLRGIEKREAIESGAKAPMWGLFGATLIAIFSFLPLYLAKSGVSEIVQPLFVVISISLMLSWLLALTQTPLFALMLFKNKSEKSDKTPYSSRFYRGFETVLKNIIRFKYTTLFVAIILLFTSLFVMGNMPQNFFPSLDKEYFRTEIFLPNGYSIRDTEKECEKLEKWLLSQKGVVKVSTTIGSSAPRYYLASAAFGPMPNFAAMLVEVVSKDSSAIIEERYNSYAQQNFPNLVVKSSLFKVSPVPEATIEIGFVGENIDTLVALTQKVKEIMYSDSLVDRVRDSWGSKIPTLTPQYSVAKGGRLGVTRAMMSQSYSMIAGGFQVGTFSFDDEYIPIMLSAPMADNFNLNDVANIPIFASGGRSMPLSSVTSSIDFGFNFYSIRRYNHSRIMLAQCEPKRGANSSAAFGSIYKKVVESVEIPAGYKLQVKGEQESQEESNSALAANLPLTLILMFIALLLLFRGFKKPFVILLMVPMIFIGVVLGLFVTGKMFDFFCILGLLGLIGMNIKNGIVLIDQIDIERQGAISHFDAVVLATKSRLLPVVLASGTTILGMIPLLFDAMFGGMAATIMGGLFVATIITLLLLPSVYAIFFGVKESGCIVEK